MNKRVCIAVALCAVLLSTMADTSGMSFWKNDDSSGTNRSDAAGISLQACSTVFSTTPLSDTVELSGLCLDTRPLGLIIIFK